MLQAHQSLLGAPPASRPRIALAGCRRIVGVSEGKGLLVSRTGVGGWELRATRLIALSPTWDPGPFPEFVLSILPKFCLRCRLEDQHIPLPVMTSYTRIPDEERPTISVDALQPIARIEDNTYGGFTE